MNKPPAITTKQPPRRSKGLLSDIRYFFISNPKPNTLVRFKQQSLREEYTDRILQRTGIGVDKYRMLNIHKIGVEAPASYLFEELLRWNGDSTCWPNYIAKLELIDNQLEKISISLFGLSKHSSKDGNGKVRLPVLQLFNLDAIKIQRIPDPSDNDNARFLLYKCSGGYPIGVFSMYVRSSIPEIGETEMSQLFILVGFNFYGKESLSKLSLINKTWEAIHNRVTLNVAHRLKQLSEWRFDQIQNPHSELE
jgi:hypothetical protein